jgi:hypothetical protein
MVPGSHSSINGEEKWTRHRFMAKNLKMPLFPEFFDNLVITDEEEAPRVREGPR